MDENVSPRLLLYTLNCNIVKYYNLKIIVFCFNIVSNVIYFCDGEFLSAITQVFRFTRSYRNPFNTSYIIGAEIGCAF